MEMPNYTVVNFCKDMAPINLLYRAPRTKNNMWVFWSREGEREDWPHHPQTDVFSSSSWGDLCSVIETFTYNNRGNVQEYLKYVLYNAEYTESANVPLIQFWAPTTTSSTTGGRCVLKTSNQPFGLYTIERGVCEYRKYCTSLEFNVFQDEKDEDDLGQVLRRELRDYTEEASSRSTKDYLLRDFARKCGIRRSVFLPLFKPSSWCCSGVLELVDTVITDDSFYPLLDLAKVTFKEVNLGKSSALKLLESTEIEEINKALQGVCTAHQLPLAQIWIPCCTSTAMAYVDSQGERCHFPGLTCSNKFSSSISQNDDVYSHFMIKHFNDLSLCHIIAKGEGVVGKALLYQKPYFCRDVTQLSQAEYPLSCQAHSYGLTACYAIWLRSTRTMNCDYVLEFFPAPWYQIFGDPQTYLELLLTTVKKLLPDFNISSVGEESCVEVGEISVNDDEPDSVIISQTPSDKPAPESFANEKETVQNEVEGEITTRHPPMPESLRSENEVVQQLSDDEPTMEEAVRKNELNVGIVKQTNTAVTSSERIFSRAEAGEREYRTTNITLSREDLTKHFGKKLNDAARILKVSRSTMKRAMRLHDIDKWPVPKRKKVNALRVRTGNEGIEGTYKGDLSCSDPPPTPATAGISHKTSNSTQEHDVGNVTIKATHGNKTFRFKLPFLSRKTDLVDKLTMRLSLNEGSFDIKYQDEENEWISIECDEDLEECIGIWKGKSIIKMLVEPITNQAT